MTRINILFAKLAFEVIIVSVLLSIEVNTNGNVGKDFRFISYQGNKHNDFIYFILLLILPRIFTCLPKV